MTKSDILISFVLPLIIAIASSGLIQFLVTRHDNKKSRKQETEAIKQEIRSIKGEVKELRGEFSEHKAILARTNILQFADELHDGRYHSDESFRQQIQDIDTYNRYCDKHEDFKNGLTAMASEYIIKEYHKRFLNDEPA